MRQGWDVVKECWLLSKPAWHLNWHLPSLAAILPQIRSSALELPTSRILSTHGVDPALRDRLSLSQVTRDWCINRGAGIILQWELWAYLWVKYLGQYYEHIISRHLSLESKIKIGDFLVNQSKEKELFDLRIKSVGLWQPFMFRSVALGCVANSAPHFSRTGVGTTLFWIFEVTGSVCEFSGCVFLPVGFNIVH